MTSDKLPENPTTRALLVRIDSLPISPWLKFSGYGELPREVVAYILELERRMVALEATCGRNTEERNATEE